MPVALSTPHPAHSADAPVAIKSRWHRSLYGKAVLRTIAFFALALSMPAAQAHAQIVLPVGQSSSVQTATLQITTAGTPSAINVLTQGAANLDFTLVSGGTCATGTAYAASVSCTVEFTFTPSHPGLRIGGITLTAGTGTVLASAYISATGTAPQVAFSGTATIANQLGGGFNSPWGVAADAVGNVYVGDYGNKAVEEVPAGCASSNCKVALGGGFTQPTGVAVDGLGNVYVADMGAPAVKQIPQGCNASTCVVTLGGGFGAPRGIAVDAGGNVYASDGALVKKIPLGCANASCVSTFANGFSDPGQIAIDQAGNLYVADDSQNEVLEIPSGCTTSSCRVSLGGGFTSPYGVAVDAGGRVYVAADGTNVIWSMQPGCTTSSCVNLLTSGLDIPYNLALDGSGNLYVAAKLNNTVEQFALASAPSVIFATTTTDGTTDTTDGTLTVQVYNNGNQPLAFRGLSYGTDFPEASDYSNACYGTLSLASGAECILPVTFAPVSPANGALNEQITLNDNALNASGATQGVPVSGNAFVQTYKLTLSVNNSAYGAVSPASGGSYAAGSSVNISATAKSGYYFVNWTGSADIVSASSASTSITMNGPESIQANFAAIPGIVVTTAADDPVGLPANCPSSNNCSLRDALSAAIATGAGNITFSPTVFATAQTITLGSGGTLSLPANTSIVGPTTGSGAALTQLVTLSGGSKYQIVDVVSNSNGGNASISGLALVNGSIGGAILASAPLNVTNCSFSNNSSVNGGAIDASAALTVTNSTFSNNSASSNGGAIYATAALTVGNSTFQGNYTGTYYGGAIYALGAFSVTGSTFANNYTSNSNVQNAGSGSYGGAIASASALSVANSTFLNNGRNIAFGGAIYAGGALTVTNSTFSGNSVTAYTIMVAGRMVPYGGVGGVMDAVSSQPNVIDNSIFSGNSGSFDAIDTTNTAADHNLYYGGDACNGCSTNTHAVSGNPLLSALGNYGGQTQTLLPLPGSAAICAGVSESVNGAPIAADQRGTSVPTTYGPTNGSVQCYDIGAVQTDYGLSFTTDPSSTQAVAQPLLPAPVLTLTESGNGFVAESVNLTVAAAVGTLSGTATQSTSTTAGATAGQVTFAGLSISPAESSDSLISSLTLTASGAATSVSITATSSGFGLGSGDTAPAITSAASTTFTPSVPNTFAVTATGYPPPAFTEAGNLPSGVTLAGNGVLSGTPAAGTVGSYPITIQASNNVGSPATQNFTLTVTNSTATVTLGNLAQTYTGSPLAVNVTTTPTNLATTVTYTGIAPTVYAQNTTPPTAAGSYAVNASINSGQGYTGSATATLVISNATATISLSNLNQTYTGSPLAATITTTPNNIAYSVSYSGSGYGPTSTPPTNAGSYAVAANITGVNYTGSATNTLVIAPATSNITLSASANSVFLLNPITLTATVASTAGTPSGTVSFYNGSTLLGQSALVSGVAMLTTSSLAAGTQQITASYQGSNNFSPSATNGSLNLVVQNLNLSISSPTGTAQPGGSAVFTFTVSPTGGTTFPSAVSFNITGLPSGATYTFSPSPIPAGSGSTVVTLTVQVPENAASNKPASEGPTLAGAGMRMVPFALALLLLPFARKLRRAGRRFSRHISMALLLVASMSAACGIAACGGAGSNAVQQQTYNLTITVTAGSLSSTFNATLTVG